MIKILIVEDSLERIGFFKDLYQLQGLSIYSDPNRAIKKLKSNFYDIIHLDYDLGSNINSLGVAGYIRAGKLDSTIIIHSEHPRGVEHLLQLLPDAYAIPFWVFNSSDRFSNQWKAAMCRPDINSVDSIKNLLEEFSRSET